MKKNLPILLALAALLVLGVLRYDHFASAYNINSFWRYNSMFALISVGMAFVSDSQMGTLMPKRCWIAVYTACTRTKSSGLRYRLRETAS